MAAFLDVIMRGLALAGQAVAIGGVLFALLVFQSRRVWTVVAGGAAVVIAAQACALFIVTVELDAPSAMLLGRLAETQYFRATLARMLAAAVILIGALAVRRAPRVGSWWPILLGGVAALVLSAAWMSHAAARLDHRGLLLALDALHQLAAAAWIGGLLHLIVTALRRDPTTPATLLRRFSTLALAAVGTLLLAGIGLTVGYVDSARGMVGTAYGLMVMTKIVMLGLLLLFGALNFFVVRRLPHDAAAAPLRLRRYVEVELGLGLTVLFAAASLTSLPPTVDVVADRATPGEVLTRFIPRLPRLSSPPLEALPINDKEAPRTAEDRAWSEFNHHVSGTFVLVMGLLGLLQGRARWARHWPLVFLGLAAFMMVRNDPGAWPLGPQGFWESLREPSVLQHRTFVLLVVIFGLFEWMVRSGRLRAPRAALLFPLLCAVGGGLLLTHSHASFNLKEEFLTEVTHAPLGVLGVLVGWGRWLELRLAAPEDRLPGRLSACAMAVIGVLLLLYRES
ncbi:MAG TPA: CopD family protein [Methylomirabilota bacterium]|nr:CopD family protein [Methylomirabilota bacterium]